MRDAKEESRKGGFELRKGAGLQCLRGWPMKALLEKQLLSNEMKEVRELAGSCFGEEYEEQVQRHRGYMGLFGARIGEEASVAGDK